MSDPSSTRWSRLDEALQRHATSVAVAVLAESEAVEDSLVSEDELTALLNLF